MTGVRSTNFSATIQMLDLQQLDLNAYTHPEVGIAQPLSDDAASSPAAAFRSAGGDGFDRGGSRVPHPVPRAARERDGGAASGVFLCVRHVHVHSLRQRLSDRSSTTATGVDATPSVLVIQASTGAIVDVLEYMPSEGTSEGGTASLRRRATMLSSGQVRPALPESAVARQRLFLRAVLHALSLSLHGDDVHPEEAPHRVLAATTSGGPGRFHEYLATENHVSGVFAVPYTASPTANHRYGRTFGIVGEPLSSYPRTTDGVAPSVALVQVRVEFLAERCFNHDRSVAFTCSEVCALLQATLFFVSDVLILRVHVSTALLFPNDRSTDLPTVHMRVPFGQRVVVLASAVESTGPRCAHDGLSAHSAPRDVGAHIRSQHWSRSVCACDGVHGSSRRRSACAECQPVIAVEALDDHHA